MTPTPPDRGGDPARQPELSFPAHRGIFLSDKVYHSSNSGIGMHWSADQKIAEEMASHAGTNLGSGTPIIYHGEIPISSVETDFNRLYDRSVLSPSNLNENREKEVPVKRGAPILVTGRTKGTLRNGVWKTRERTYKKPREMKA
jgi:hypothetical protein